PLSVLLLCKCFTHFFLCFLADVDAVIELTQTPAVHTVSPGQQAVLNCNIERYDGNYVYWHKQVPGGFLRMVEVFSILFIIKQAETGDTAVYYCQTRDSSSLPPPVLTVFPPSSAELQSNTASLVCLSSQSVTFADVSWLAGGSPVSSQISTSTAVQRPDQTYQISSSLTIQTSDWNMDKVYTCKVSLGSQTSEKTIKKSECPTEYRSVTPIVCPLLLTAKDIRQVSLIKQPCAPVPSLPPRRPVSSLRHPSSAAGQRPPTPFVKLKTVIYQRYVFGLVQ
uniref:Ig-like domain-containing protein n=1 Tax=Oreochromis aureus TaxID=47969 RepID=A0AAZ1XSL7_OREAU